MAFDEEFYLDKAENMRKYVNYNNVGRKHIDFNRADLVRATAVKAGSFQGLDKKEVVRRVLVAAEKVQEEAFIQGAKSVVSLNGKFVVKDVEARPVKHLISTDLDELPPRNKIVFEPGRKIKNLNKAFKLMSYAKDKSEE